MSGTSLRVGKHDRDEGGGSVDQLSATGSSDDTDEAEYGILVEGLYAILSYCAVGCGSLVGGVEKETWPKRGAGAGGESRGARN